MVRKPDRLTQYRDKRDFSKTAEPSGQHRQRGKRKALSYVIQKHAARHEHYDFRLEHDGVLLSWAVPKGPSFDPRDKRLAVHVEDHPLDYGTFEGSIPKGEYGGGTVMLWDRGTWVPDSEDVDQALSKGKLAFELFGERLQGHWALVRLRGRAGDRGRDNWLLIKEKDKFDREGRAVTERETTSVATGRTMSEIAAGGAVWSSKQGKQIKPARERRPRSRVKAKVGKTATRAVNKKKSKAREIKIPPFIKPQLATLVDAPPNGPEWIHEIKWDGYRALTSIAGETVIIRTRSGLDWTDKFRSLVEPLTDLPCKSALIDGEIIIVERDGRSNFGALQDALSSGTGGLSYGVFDLLHLDGEDLRDRPLRERKQRLQRLLEKAPGGGPLLFSGHIAGAGAEVMGKACALGLEGIVSKRLDAPYRSSRTLGWVKSKCGFEQEFVVVGWTPSPKPGRPFASILLAVNEKGRLRYAGRVGSGFSDRQMDDLARKLSLRARKSAAVDGVPPSIARGAKFVAPDLVAEIAFRGWTRDRLVRQGSFKGLRQDKPARVVVEENPMPAKKAAAKRASKNANASSRRGDRDEIQGVSVTHPDKVLFAGQGVSKRDLIDYYLAVADRMLPHVAGRPLSLVRCPSGSGKACFFQKHANPGWPDDFKHVRIREKSGSDDYLYIEDERGLIAAVQMGVLELHVWGSRVDDVEHPDRMVFDLDPDEGLDFQAVREGARELKQRLAALGLDSFPMATGGKGIHVVVPLAAGHSWDAHREFAEALARLMAEDTPDRYVANMSKAKRRGKIFIDYLRNQRGSTAIAPYSTRARPGAHVAFPISWAALGRLKDAHPASVADAARKAAQQKDPWPGYFRSRQKLPDPLAKNRAG